VTRNSDFKRLVRQRMAETGETYTVARSHFAQPPTAATPKRAAGQTIAAFRKKVYQRARTEDLAQHLTDRYGVNVSGTTELDLGVYRVDLSGEPSWVARVFPATRSFDAASGDAEILAFLEEHGFPAERLAAAEPISDLARQPVLVTKWIDGTNQRSGKRNDLIQSLGALLGRLHALPPMNGACGRPAGSWHHLSVNGGGRRNDIEIIVSLLQDKHARATHDDLPLIDDLSVELASFDDLSDLPTTLTHPDPCRANLIAADGGDGVLVDWTGAGRGPRVASFASLIWSLTSFAHIDEAVGAYRNHSSLEAGELDRLEAALVGFPTVLLCWQLLFRKMPVRDVLHTITTQRERANRIADHVRAAWAAPTPTEVVPVGEQDPLF